jgi:hypothetical protein
MKRDMIGLLVCQVSKGVFDTLRQESGLLFVEGVAAWLMRETVDSDAT